MVNNVRSISQASVLTTRTVRLRHTFLTPVGVAPDLLARCPSRSRVISATMLLTDVGNWKWTVLTESFTCDERKTEHSTD